MAGYNDFALFYDHLQMSGEFSVDYNKIGEYLDRMFSLYSSLSESETHGKKGLLLDAACGTGSLSIVMEKLQYDVIAVDVSDEMLSVAMSKNAENVQFLKQDLTQLDLFGTIDYAVSMFDSINHLGSKADVKMFFEKVSLFMNKGGVFIFDVNTVYKHREVLGNNTFIYDTDDLYTVWQNFFDEKESRVDIELDFFQRNGDNYIRYFDNFEEYAYPLSEIHEMLTDTGFEVQKTYDFLTENQGSENSEKVIFIAKKEKNGKNS